MLEKDVRCTPEPITSAVNAILNHLCGPDGLTRATILGPCLVKFANSEAGLVCQAKANDTELSGPNSDESVCQNMFEVVKCANEDLIEECGEDAADYSLELTQKFVSAYAEHCDLKMRLNEPTTTDIWGPITDAPTTPAPETKSTPVPEEKRTTPVKKGGGDDIKQPTAAPQTDSAPSLRCTCAPILLTGLFIIVFRTCFGF
jgi:hypothetical protein